ncbi:hypothetical protein HW115_12500 [Verrucomicrobiaceae bacterium N1E253]|uniref:Uncharacterized protein n=1 Tax=Oceaniferula marina TaxID=2748318 RepID=A0A851GQJ3_9BACT|nr:hypothetical protein [Oceaniferula marina]NWK56434.1 hypothetical protein [Oceaniferula marina]
MSKIFGTLAAVFLAVAAFVAFKNKEAKEVEIGDFKKALQVEKTTTNDLNAQIKRRKDAEDLRDQHKDAAVALNKELEKEQADYDTAKKDIVKLEAEFNAKKQELAQAADALKDLPDPEELIPKIKRMRAQLTEATDAIASAEARKANLIDLDTNGKARIKTTRELIELQSSGKSFPTLKTRISSVYRNWGFVILAAGDRQGVVSGSTLDVLRGGDVIAKLKVTAVEAGRASADVVLDSVAEGVTLRAGDTVMAEREEAKPNPATAAN